VILSGVMLLEYLGWTGAARLIEDAMEATIRKKTVTYDFERQMEGARKVATSEFADLMIASMEDKKAVLGTFGD
jgi:isocitrate dehydrogenase